MSWRFRPPPGWPIDDPDWLPPPGWSPEPDWPPAPPGWTFWTQAQQPTQPDQPPERVAQTPWTPRTVESAQREPSTQTGAEPPGPSRVGFPAPSPDHETHPRPWRIGSRSVVATLVTLTVLAGIVVVPQVVSWWNGRLPEGTQELLSTDHGTITAIGVTQVDREPVAVLQEYPAADLFTLNLATGARRTLPHSRVSEIAMGELAGAPVALTVVADEENLVQVWDVRSGRLVQTLPGHGRINSIVAGTVDGVDVAITTSGVGGIARLWDLESGELLDEVLGSLDDHNVAHAIAFTEVDGEPVVVIGRPDGLIAYRITPELRFAYYQRLACPDNSLIGVAGGVATGELDGTPVVVAGCRSTVLWNLRTGNVIRTLDDDLGEPYATVIVAQDDTTVAMMGRFSDPMLCWDLASGEVIREIDLTARWLAVTELGGKSTVVATDLEGRLLTWPLG